MSAEQNESNPAPSAAEKSSVEKPPVDAAPKTPPGVIGEKLEILGLPVIHLGLDASGLEAIEVPATHLLQIATFLKEKVTFDLCLSCAGVDRKTYRESVYHLYSTETHQTLVLKVKADGQEHSPSLMPVWPAVDWHERETYDLMGIVYDGHPHLTRILMPNDWLGHPLRKDYKVDDPRLVWNER